MKDLAQSFIGKLTNMTAGFREVIQVFDTYKPASLKQKTRERRQQDKAPVQYKIEDDISIEHILLTRFLSHQEIKADLSVYLAQATLNYKLQNRLTSAFRHVSIMSNQKQ